MNRYDIFSDPKELDSIESLDQIKKVGLCLNFYSLAPEFTKIFEQKIEDEKLSKCHGRCQLVCTLCTVSINDKRYKAKHGIEKLQTLIPELRVKVSEFLLNEHR